MNNIKTENLPQSTPDGDDDFHISLNLDPHTGETLSDLQDPPEGTAVARRAIMGILEPGQRFTEPPLGKREALEILLRIPFIHRMIVLEQMLIPENIRAWCGGEGGVLFALKSVLRDDFRKDIIEVVAERMPHNLDKHDPRLRERMLRTFRRGAMTKTIQQTINRRSRMAIVRSALDKAGAVLESEKNKIERGIRGDRERRVPEQRIRAVWEDRGRWIVTLLRQVKQAIEDHAESAS